MSQNKWDRDYLDLAKFWAEKRSKDPSTKVGAIIVRPDNTVVSLGYNGFPRGIKDDERLDNREEKNRLTVHAEINSIHNSREVLEGYTLYVWPPSFHCPTCDQCALHVIQKGIKRVVGYKANNLPYIRNNIPYALRWKESNILAMYSYREAGVEVVMI